MPNAIEVEDAALVAVLFTPLIVPDMDQLKVMTPPEGSVDDARRPIGFVYETDVGDPIVIFEYLVDRSAAVAEYNDIASVEEGCTEVPPVEGLGGSEPGLLCHSGRRTLVDLAGAPGLLLQGDDGGSALFFVVELTPEEAEAITDPEVPDDAAIEVEIEASPGSVSPDELLELAASMQRIKT